MGQPTAIPAAQQQLDTVPVRLPPVRVPVAPSLLRVDTTSDMAAPTALSFLDVNPYVAILEKQGQILLKFADTIRATAVKPVLTKRPEQYKLKWDICSWLSQFETYLAPTPVEQSNKAQYLLTNLSSEAYAQLSKVEWPSDTLSEYGKLKDALKHKVGPTKNSLLSRSQCSVAERADKESAVNSPESLRGLLKPGYQDSGVKGLEPVLVNQFSR